LIGETHVRLFQLPRVLSVLPRRASEHHLPAAVLHRNPWWLLGALLCGYVFAWVGHFFFEKNRPATFKHPFYSFIGDWVMYKDILIGRIKF
jgi:hypothetical protein